MFGSRNATRASPALDLAHRLVCLDASGWMLVGPKSLSMNPAKISCVLRSSFGLKSHRTIAGVGESRRDWWGQAAFAANRPLLGLSCGGRRAKNEPPIVGGRDFRLTLPPPPHSLRRQPLRRRSVIPDQRERGDRRLRLTLLLPLTFITTRIHLHTAIAVLQITRSSSLAGVVASGGKLSLLRQTKFDKQRRPGPRQPWTRLIGFIVSTHQDYIGQDRSHFP